MIDVNEILNKGFYDFKLFFITELIQHEDYDKFLEHNSVEQIAELIDFISVETRVFYDFIMFGIENVKIDFPNDYSELYFEYDKINEYTPYRRKKK